MTGTTSFSRWWRADASTWAVRFALAVAIGLIVRGVMLGVTGDERAGLPPLVESVSPVPESVQVPSQSAVVVDLAAGHTGVLVIDGVEIETVSIETVRSSGGTPGVQVDLPPATIYEPGNAVLTFTPAAGAPITEFTVGEHRVDVVYWAVADGRERARTFTWTFTVV